MGSKEHMKIKKGELLSATTSFKRKAVKVHGAVYSYDKVLYKTAKTKITIGCTVHGYFTQTPSDHLGGRGCKLCGYKKIGEAVHKRKIAGRVSIEAFIERAVFIHGHTYDYSKVVFTYTKDKVDIVCPYHGSFSQEVTKHLLGNGCPACAKLVVKNGWSAAEWGKHGSASDNFEGFTLYVVRLHDEKESFYKVGKTFRCVSSRFRDVPYRMDVCMTFCGTADSVSEKELRLHKLNKCNKYSPINVFCGKEECYTCVDFIMDVLNEN